MRRKAIGLAIATACVAMPLAAQTAAPEPPSADPGIVVNGEAKAPSGDEVFDEARGITRVSPYALYEEALPRFWGPVCPGVSGLRQDYAQAMVERMRATVTRLRLRLAKQGCSPNLVVAFEDDGRTLLADLQRDRPNLFHLISQTEQAELLSEPGPVHVWNNIATRWTGAGPPPEKGLKPSVWGQLNRNAMPLSFDITGALVVFDRAAAEGMTLTQLADYATMRGLSHTRPANGGQPMATILALFDGEGGEPEELTDFDIGYLRSLYSWEPNTSAAHKLVDVRRWMEKAKAQADRNAIPP